MYHNSVLLGESISFLITNPDGKYIDATFGGGGHTAHILSRLSPSGKLIAFDRDTDALAGKPDDARLTLVHNNFRFIDNFRRFYFGEEKVDGILADLGVSSHQFDTPERGFSFRFDAPLDMRMDKGRGRSAADIVNESDEGTLERILRVYGEVDGAGRIAGLIIVAREKSPIETTGQLNAAIGAALPKIMAHKQLAKIYQALRIEVNGEMKALEKLLIGSARSLKEGGRLVVISYHSLEDRMVKNFIKYGNVEGKAEKDIYGNWNAPLRAVNRKPILPAENEIASNTRARSAKLRVAEKI